VSSPHDEIVPSGAPGGELPMEIVLVDDEPSIREMLATYLSEEGYRVRTAGTGEEALWLLDDKPADIVFTDVKMPGISGLQVLRRVRESWPATEVILITGYAAVEDAVEALREGAADFLLKPVRLAHLDAVARRCAERIRFARDNRALRDVVEKLQELNLRKEKFIALANHELRTPTTVAAGLASLLVSSHLEGVPEPARDLVLRVDVALRRLREIVDDLGDLALTEAGTLELRRTRESLARLLEDLETTIRTYEGLRQLSLELLCDADRSLEIVADRRKLNRALAALVQNAVKFTPDGGSVRVRVFREAAHLAFEVEDTGMGVPPAEAQKIFELFYEVGDTRHHRTSPHEFGGGGLGIGLPLASAIARGHRGSLEYRPRADGGSIFTLRLPLE
jgi:two-component system, sensor histidine kinase